MADTMPALSLTHPAMRPLAKPGRTHGWRMRSPRTPRDLPPWVGQPDVPLLLEWCVRHVVSKCLDCVYLKVPPPLAHCGGKAAGRWVYAHAHMGASVRGHCERGGRMAL